MYGGKFAFQKLTELVCSGKEIYHFCFVLLCIRGKMPSTSPPGDLYSEGRFNGGFFALRFLGGLYLEGLINGGAYFRNFTVFLLKIQELLLKPLVTKRNRSLYVQVTIITVKNQSA